MINRNVNLREQIPNALNKVKTITNDQLSYIINNIPHKWGCNPEEKSALLNYLTTRLSRVNELVNLLSEVM